MIFSMHQKTMAGIIQDVQRAVATSSTIPILSGILVTTKKDQIILTATDLEIGIESRGEGEITEEGSIVLPAQHFSSIIRELPAEMISFKLEEDQSLKINCLRSEYRIKGYNPDEFPTLPQIQDGTHFTMEQPRLKNIVKEIRFAASTDENQPFLHGALLNSVEGKMEIVATDTYRLACRRFSLGTGDELADVEVIIPLKTLQELDRLLNPEEGDVDITLKGNHLLFSFPPLTITSRLKEGQFPNYHQVIPEEFSTSCVAKRSELLQAVRRAALIAREDSNTIEFRFGEGELTLKTRDSKIGQAHEVVGIEREGPEVNAAFTADYILDVLKVIEQEKVSINLDGSEGPCVIRGIKDLDFTYVIMPIRD